MTEDNKPSPEDLALLPTWATWMKPGKYAVDPDGFFPEILEAIGAPKKLDQCWLEKAFQCMKMEIQRVIRNTSLDPRPDRPLEIKVLNRPSWALVNFPVGGTAEDLAEAVKRGGRAAYIEWRGYIPN